MKKLIIIFIIISLIKGGLLFISILTSDWIPTLPILLKTLVFFILIWFVDNITLTKLNSVLVKPGWFKLTTFLFGTYVMILFVTGPLFILYNWIFNIQADTNAKMPTTALIGFLILGLIMTSINSAMTIKRQIRTTANKS